MVHPALVLALLATLQVSALGATTTDAIAAREYLETHNEARAAVGVQPLRWSQKLADAANRLVIYQRDRHGCQLANSTEETYGRNQRMGELTSPRWVVESWLEEKNFYSYSNNSCVADHKCGVYTQVVWRKSLELGCELAWCEKENTSFAVCYYNPPGNIAGEKPY